jgi:cellulose biosynthesis protein BcsQ
MIIFINGSINAGKTTVAQILAKKLSNVALVEIDTLRDMIGWMSIDKAVPINLENAVSVIKNFSNNGLNVIVPYPLSQNNYDYIVSKLCDIDTKIYVFTLAPKLEKVITDRGNRKLSDWERERIRHHYDIGIHKPIFGEIIDNSEQTPDKTANIILAKVASL